MNLSTLKDAKPALLVSAGDAWGKVADDFQGHVKDSGKYLHQRLQTSWQSGLGAESADDRLGRMQYDLAVAKRELDSVGRVLRDAGEVFLAHQGRLKNLIAEAKEAGFTVHDDGSVSGPDLAYRCAKGNWSVGFLEMNLADKLDDGVLSKIGMPEKSASPRAVSSWWASLPPELRKKLLEDHPVVLGNRDGIPAADREAANRAYLPTLLHRLEADAKDASGDRKDGLNAKLDGLKGIQKQLVEGGEPRPYLLAMSSEGNGRAVVAFGDPDTAKNVSAYVPGLNTKLDGHFVSSDVQRARDIADAAHKASPNSPTSSIVWLGYDAPQLKGSGTFDVMWDDNARKGAPAYDRFLDGVRATHQGAAPHVTAIGHSYGSLTVGQASQQPGGLPADDVVLVGSPGVGVNRASDLGVGEKHVYVGAAENDQVTYLPPSVQRLPDYLDYIAPGSESGSRKAAFGVDPASRNFGGHHFEVEAGEDTGIVGLMSSNTPAHSLYFDPQQGEKSLQNIAKVVTGHGDKVTPVAPR